MDSLKYWTGQKIVVFTDYLVKDGRYYLPANGIYYPADKSRIMHRAGTTADGFPLYEKDIIEYTERGVSYRSPIFLNEQLGTYMVNVGTRTRVLGKFILEHAETKYIGSEFEKQERKKNVLPFVAHTEEPITDEDNGVCIYIASTKVNDGEERGYAKWAYIMLRGTKYAQKTGEGSYTANRAYLTAMIAALSRVKEGSAVHLFSKSKYITDPFEKGWLKNWKDAGWLRGDLEPVQNLEEWKLIDTLSSRFTITTHWVDKKKDNDKMQQRCEDLIYEGKNSRNYA